MKIMTLFAASIVSILSIVTAVTMETPVDFLMHGDPLFTGAVLCGAFIAASFILSWLTGDYSQTDRLWSITPVLYAWLFALRGWSDPRLMLMAALVTLWGARLTFNFARKGGYTSAEDYRWVVLRGKITNPVLWQLFNLFFIAGYQHFLIFLITLPAYAAYLNRGKALGAMDGIAAGLFILMLIFETIADRQMWRFQEEKKRKISLGGGLEGDIKSGFITSGLFRFSRHPNYFAEVSLWWAFYLFVPAATVDWLHWTIAGTVLLTLLFQGSIQFTESISAGKYPGYDEYRRRVSRFLPWFSRSMDGKG